LTERPDDRQRRVAANPHPARPTSPDGHRNWLRAPVGPFNLLLRLIWLLAEVLYRIWTLPAVVPVSSAASTL
jgi:hypothetical protein